MRALSWPAFYALELTPTCNNSCAGCSNVFVRSRSDHPTPGTVWQEWLSEFGPHAAGIRLTGGEPTLHPDFLDIVEASCSYGANVTVFTNGRWPDPERLVAAARHRQDFAGFLVSLHGGEAKTHEAFTSAPGSFDETVANIELCVDAGVGVALCMVITRENWGEIDRVVALGKQLGVEHVAFNRYLGRPGPIEPDQAALRQAVRRVQTLIDVGESVTFGNGFPQCFSLNSSTGCLAGAAYVAVDPWGGVHPCPRSPTVVGSLRDGTLAELWLSAAMQAWRDRTEPSCSQCAAFSTCHGGCRVLSEIRPEGDPLCGLPLARFSPRLRAGEVAGDARPRLNARIRSADFGFTVIGSGAVLPVDAAALPVLEACDGNSTFDELADAFGDPGWDLLAALWHLNMLILM